MPPGSTAFPHPRGAHCDVLVLGAGLAGLRAAWAAKQHAPNLRVVIATPSAGPSGSSFANRNNALGMQVPSGAQAAAFVDEALSLAAPGLALRPLVEALAEDAEARLADLLDLGLAFRRDANAELQRFPGCFSAAPRAVIYTGLAAAHRAFLGRVLGLGVELLPGVEAVGLNVDSGRVCGAQMRDVRGGDGWNVRAGAVIAALGGPAPLFARRTCGTGGTGLSYGLLAQAGARLVNAPYLQFFWVHPKTLRFTNPAELDWAGAMRDAGPYFPPQLIQARRMHCPTAYGLPDAAIDARLLGQQSPNGICWATGAGGVLLPLVLAAHAGNGGALIDTAGRTTVPGLYACGECASGMHGANRLGGGMVLAALVFGARAGAEAAREALQGHATATAEAQAPCDAPRSQTAATPQPFLRTLRRNMQRHGLLAGIHGQGTRREAFVSRLQALADAPGTPQRQRLLGLSALAVLGAATGGS